MSALALHVLLERLDDGLEMRPGFHYHFCLNDKCGGRTKCMESPCNPLQSRVCARCMVMNRERRFVSRRDVHQHPKRRRRCTPEERQVSLRRIRSLESWLRDPTADRQMLTAYDQKALVQLAKTMIAELWTHDCIYGVGAEVAA